MDVPKGHAKISLIMVHIHSLPVIGGWIWPMMAKIMRVLIIPYRMRSESWGIWLFGREGSCV